MIELIYCLLSILEPNTLYKCIDVQHLHVFECTPIRIYIDFSDTTRKPRVGEEDGKGQFIKINLQVLGICKILPPKLKMAIILLYQWWANLLEVCRSYDRLISYFCRSFGFVAGHLSGILIRTLYDVTCFRCRSLGHSGLRLCAYLFLIVCLLCFKNTKIKRPRGSMFG